jgi:hypothetical protein
VNTTWYIEHRSARQQHADPRPSQLHTLGVTKEAIRNVFGTSSI